MTKITFFCDSEACEKEITLQRDTIQEALERAETYQWVFLKDGSVFCCTKHQKETEALSTSKLKAANINFSTIDNLCECCANPTDENCNVCEYNDEKEG